MTNAEARFNNSLRPRKPEGSLGRTTQDVHLYSHTAPELWTPLTRMTLALMWAGNCVGQFNVSTSFLTNIQSAKSSKPCSEDCCFRKSRHEHVRPLLKALHWLPVKDRIIFKITTFVFCLFDGTLPPYQSCLSVYTPPLSIPIHMKKTLVQYRTGIYSPKMKGANWLKGRSLVNIFSLWNIWYKSVVLSLIWLHSLVC